MQDWNTRYDREDYVFGTAPAQALPRNAALLPAGGRALCVADGEGRNSAWLAEQGFEVTAFDPAENALAKARRLAAERGVSVRYRRAGLEDWDWSAPGFDLVAAIFIQFVPPADRPRVFANLARAVAPGGVLFLHGYTPEQVDLGTGGPPNRDHMYTEEMLRDAFSGMEILRLEAYEAELEEGVGHRGRSALIDLVARR